MYMRHMHITNSYGSRRRFAEAWRLLPTLLAGICSPSPGHFLSRSGYRLLPFPSASLSCGGPAGHEARTEAGQPPWKAGLRNPTHVRSTLANIELT
jgi:hypothetical protein